jgi:urease accessory protein UreE
MLRGLGAHVTPIEAIFEPEPGAYHALSQHSHDQDAGKENTHKNV